MTGPRFSVHQLCLPGTTFAEDVRGAAEAGYQGIGIDVGKLDAGAESDEAALEAFRASGLRAGVGCAVPWAILPTSNFAQPADPAERIALILAGVRRLAPFGSDSVFCVLGPEAALGASRDRRIVEDGLRAIHDAAGEHGMTLSVEPMVREGGVLVDRPLVASIGETVELLDRLGLRDAQVVADIWHLHDSAGFLDELRDWAPRLAAIQMCDYHPPRGWRDRLMPGDGEGRVRAALAAAERGGFSGWLDLEVFSDELWELPRAEFLRRGLAAMRDCWQERG